MTDHRRTTLAQVEAERDEAQREASRLHECRDTWKVQAESLAVHRDEMALALRQLMEASTDVERAAATSEAMRVLREGGYGD